MKRILFIFIIVSLFFSITGYAQDTYQFVLKWGSYGSGDGQFLYFRGLAVDSYGYVYVAEADNNRIQKFDSNGNFITKWGSPGDGDGQFLYPYGVAVDSDGYVYVADTYNYRIQKFDSIGNFITKWGSRGSGNGQFGEPHVVAVDSHGYVYVADTGNSRIQKFDSNGNFITKWGSLGDGNGQFLWPCGVAVDSDGYVYVADAGNSRIQKFDSNGNFITIWGSPGDGDGQFLYPYGVAVDSDGYVYVADAGNYRIQKLDSNGNFITKWGSYGSGDGQSLYLQGVAVDSDGYVYVADAGNSRIQKFAPLHVNRAPVAICQDIRRPAGNGCQADAAAQDFDNGSYDPDGDPLTFAISPVGPYPLGDTLVTLTVTDSHGAEASCSAKITVYDDSPPNITSLSANPNSLWPANHKMVPVSITISAIDSCSATVTSQIIDVTSNEPVDGLGDGDTAPDWLITGPLTLNLRAERSGNGAGRIYTITIECRDAAGNKATGIVTVKVPKSQGK
jgi:DNA-binding beta-propeller fold protein YncE